MNQIDFILYPLKDLFSSDKITLIALQFLLVEITVLIRNDKFVIFSKDGELRAFFIKYFCIKIVNMSIQATF